MKAVRLCALLCHHVPNLRIIQFGFAISDMRDTSRGHAFGFAYFLFTVYYNICPKLYQKRPGTVRL